MDPGHCMPNPDYNLSYMMLNIIGEDDRGHMALKLFLTDGVQSNRRFRMHLSLCTQWSTNTPRRLIARNLQDHLSSMLQGSH